MFNGKVAVLFGGASNESEISVITGTMCANILKNGGADVLPVYISPSGAFYCGGGLADIAVFKGGGELKFPRCFVADGGVYVRGRRDRVKFVPLYAAVNCCHGGTGEGGGAAGLFACAGIPMAGGDIFGGAAFLDKCLAKVVLRGLGVPVLDYAVIRSREDIFAALERVGLPAVVKPARLGSSIGIRAVHSREEAEEAVAAALMFDEKVLAERYVATRREVNCAAYFCGGEVRLSQCEEAFSSGGLLSFDDKYSGGGRSVIPANIPKDAETAVRGIVKNVYSSLDMRGIARFDFILEGDAVYLSEVNTVPGSLAWYLFARSFKEFFPVLEDVINQAVADFSSAGGRLLLKTGILSSVPKFGGKIK